ncbi:MAG: ABC transporter ATP-binding protein [Polyangiales bacterium]
MITLTDVKKSYGAIEALRGVTLNIADGERVAIIGPSGSGKSTLLQMIGALDVPTSGTVTIAGSDLSKLDDDALTRLRRDKIGFVFQFFNLLPTLSALENVMLPALLGGGSRKKIEERAVMLLEEVGLSARLEHRPDQLSGGEMQRVAIARALIADPPLLLCDEPTGNLDTKTGEEVLGILEGAAGKCTLVVVTHDLRVAERCARTIRLRDGVVE